MSFTMRIGTPHLVLGVMGRYDAMRCDEMNCVVMEDGCFSVQREWLVISRRLPRTQNANESRRWALQFVR